MLSALAPSPYEVVEVPLSARASGERTWHLPGRLVGDLARVARAPGPLHGIHLVGQYRRALPREAAIAMVARARRVPFLYHIKAGSFVDFATSASGPIRAATLAMLHGARVVLTEGREVAEWLNAEHGIGARWFPNFVPADAVPVEPPPLFPGPTLRVLFVGTCYAEKGVLDLLDAVDQLQREGRRVTVTFVGSPSEAFTAKADAMPHLGAIRLGVLPHAQVVAQMASCDVFAMPTRHPGEGHTNAVNEAMAAGRAIVCTRHGFLPSILEGAAVFMEGHGPTPLAAALRTVDDDRAAAAGLARRARARLLAEFHADVARPRLAAAYDALTSADGA